MGTTTMTGWWWLDTLHSVDNPNRMRLRRYLKRANAKAQRRAARAEINNATTEV